MSLITKSSELSAKETEDNILKLKLEAKRQSQQEKKNAVERARQRRLRISDYMTKLKSLTNRDNKPLFCDMVTHD